VAGIRPDREVGNAEAGAAAGVSAEWITQRTGITSRFVSDTDVTTLAVDVARRLLDSAEVDARDVDQVIVVTESSVHQSPPVAPTVAAAIGASRAGGFDVVAACAGFAYALGLARDQIVAGTSGSVLVVAAEQMSIWLDHTDASTAPVFGDGAGAALVVASPVPGLWPAATLADGTRRGLIGMRPAGWRRAFDANPPVWPVVCMEGPAVYRWVVEHGPGLIAHALERAGSTAADIEVFVPHQANLRITDALVSRSGLGHSIIADDIRTSGNTSSASIPLALARMLDAGIVRPGQLALSMGFGAGMTAAAQVFRVPDRFGFAVAGDGSTTNEQQAGGSSR